MRFTIREMMLLAVVFILGTGWALEHWLLCDRMAVIRRLHPMLYEAMTGEAIDTNNLKSARIEIRTLPAAFVP
jgi:hypothetical protein